MAAMRILMLLFIFVACSAVMPSYADGPVADTVPGQITVVSDDNYPPYIFRDINGNLQGILIDEWQLWEKKTGIKVNYIAMDWGKARAYMLAGKADVIDTIFYTKERAEHYDFTRPYAKLEVPVFFHKNLSGIVDIKSLQGLTVGVKRGDACIDVLKQNGITSLKEYDSYEEIVKAAAAHQIKVFSIDKPPALYYLFKMNLEEEFRHSLNLYTGEFHRAVKKGRANLLKAVEDGFSQITKSEHEAIEKKWLGTSFVRPVYFRYLLFVILAVGVLIISLAFFNLTLRRKVRAKTMELQTLIDNFKQSEEKYRTLVETTDTGFVIIDKNGAVLDANQKYVTLTGNDKLSEIIGHSVVEWTADYEKEKNAAAVNLCFKDGYIRGLEIDYVDSKGQIIPIEISATCMKTKDTVQIMTLCRDITQRRRAEKEQKELENRLQRAEKMEALGTLAGGVAHDLNNVLGVVIGYAELLMTSVNESDPIRPRLLNIMKGGEKAAFIVQDLLTLARRGVTGREILNLNKIIIDFQNSPELEKLVSFNTSVRIVVDLEPDLLNISGSFIHLSKTLFNLVSNAAEAMPAGGILTIKAFNQYLDKPLQGYDEIREGDYVVLSVSDTGEGIPTGNLKHIFEPFYTKKVMGRSGTGLGLAVVWGTVKDHMGYINVQSEEGSGSTFTLYFPVTRQELSAATVSASITEYMGRDESILVVDDVKEQRELAADMLRGLNYRVDIAASGEEAVAYLKEHNADLIVLDMIMDPGMDGLDTYKSILKVNPGQKCIIVSGFSETERVKAAQALGAGAYVKKPYITEILGLAVKKELDR
ncbi:MAG: Sensor histidine kinase RcsC [Syntrophus sp. SKADARSKE-3]|nr:Sensor histidine kinase RcsC [Syntrophus sp. SKADARSKE-3]